MCGIVGYIGYKNAVPILIEGLKRLEYRGYDSAGIGVVQPAGLSVFRAVGRIAELEKKIPAGLAADIGLAHTRWATHGGPSEENAHPHADAAERIIVVHNGIIENHQALKTYLQQRGIECRSETDTEVLA
ncbi:MAG: glutamine--fructose-6-phosphate aminotransferase, partial [Phycisphaerae bacterium]|nr:glutamine--fructose-6-phosphate aminotransferase [Phycisphaerae bacterium]